MSQVKMQTYHGTIYTDNSFKARNGDVYTKEQMDTIIAEFRGKSRIHKPMALLFYTDVRAGKRSAWKYSEINPNQ